jgi:hypothetical protein
MPKTRRAAATPERVKGALPRCPPHVLERLRSLAATTHDARLCRRALAVLRVLEGEPVTHVASWVGTDRRTVHRWVGRLTEAADVAALADRPGRGRPRGPGAEPTLAPSERAALG